jgi:hypothetical protein
MIWKRPKQYGLVSKAELKQTGFTDIKTLLKLPDEQKILSACNDDVSNFDELKRIWGEIMHDGKEIKKLNSNTLILFNGIEFVLSYYEGGLTSISFQFKDLIKVKEQILFDKLK